VPSHDLSSIQGLEDKHLRALARHGVSDLRGLVQADREVIYRAMANLRPRPTRDRIARWQEDAGRMLGESEPDAPDEIRPDAPEWPTAASFVVVFSKRRAGDTWERRVEVERTEVEPERNPQVWSGWECEPICGWMLGQLSQDDSTEPHQAEPAPAEPAPAEPAPAEPAPERPTLHLDSASIIDAAGRADVLTAGAVVTSLPTELVAPVRVVFIVSGARPRTRLHAVARILRPDGPGWNAQDPAVLPGSGQAEFDLSRVPAGEHELSLIAWAPDATAKPVSVRLPRITIRSS
jgi:hypothetical protein